MLEKLKTMHALIINILLLIIDALVMFDAHS